MKQLTPRERFMVFVRFGCGALCLMVAVTFFVIRVYAQSEPVSQTITVEDARQDLRLEDLKTFQQNQEGFNHEQGKRIEELESKAYGIELVGGSFLTILGVVNCVLGANHIRRPIKAIASLKSPEIG